MQSPLQDIASSAVPMRLCQRPRGSKAATLNMISVSLIGGNDIMARGTLYSKACSGAGSNHKVVDTVTTA